MDAIIPGLARFRALLRDRPGAHGQWLAVDDPEILVAMLGDLAAAAGLSRADLAQAIAAPPPSEPAEHWPPPGWLPVAIDRREGRADVRWVAAAGMDFGAPFFAEAVARVRHRPFSRLIDWRTRLADLASTAPAARTPDGLIFHWSRCGSTLAARMIGACRGVAAFAEPDPIDAVIAAQDPALLAAMTTALAHGRPDRARLVLKLDSWHIAQAPLLRRAFPDTPWIFLFRDPAAILASHARREGSQMAAGAVIDFPADAGVADRHAAVLAHIGDAAIAALGAADGAGIAVDYAALPGAITDRVLPHFAIAADAADRAAMAAIAAQDAKTPEQRFDPGAMAVATGEMTRAAARLSRHYAQLGALARD